MYLKALYLKNFRNYKDSTFYFSPKINTIYGENAVGKTNLLEAISLLMTGRSFRTFHLNELIRFGEKFFYLEAYFEKNGIEQIIKLSFDENGRKIFHNQTPLLTLSALLGILNGVILSPEDWELIRGGPQPRRHFLDLQIAKTNPLYLHHLSRYLRAMKQRNTLLKRKKKETLEIWEEEMATSASYLTLSRKKTTKEIEEEKTLLFDPLSLNYKSAALKKESDNASVLKELFLKQFFKSREREFELGLTLFGPHKDDLEILIQGKEARLYASEGQRKCSVAALRFAEWFRLKTLTDEMPLLCIDDVSACLDQKREEILMHFLENMGQIFLTTPRLLPFSEHSHLIHIKSFSL